MAINLQLYSNANTSTKSITVDFVANIATMVGDPSVDDDTRYFFKLTTGAKGLDNSAFAPKVVTKLSDLALNNPAYPSSKAQSKSGSTAAYDDISSMVADYVYDYVNGHASNASGSYCTKQYAMKFN